MMMSKPVRTLTITVALLGAACVGYGQERQEAPKPAGMVSPERLEPPKPAGLGVALTVDYLPHYQVEDGGQDFVLFLNADYYPSGVGVVTTDPTLGVRYTLINRVSPECDLTWSWLKTRARGTAGAGNREGRMGALLTSGPHRNQDVFEDDFTQAYAALELGVETMSLECGWQVPLPASADLRFFVGAEALRVNREVFGAYHDTDSDATFDSYEEDFRGYGLRVGLQNRWEPGPLFRRVGLRLYGQLGLALLSGQTEMSWFEFNPDYPGERYTAIMPDTRYRHSVTAYEVAAGLAHQRQLGAAAVTAKLGYEYTKLSGLLKSPRFVDDVYMSPNTGAQAYDLTMSGVVASLSVSF